MKMHRRGFLQSTAALAAITSLPAGPTRAATRTAAYPYWGRTDDYADFRIIEPGLTITKVESWTHGQYGIVRITTDDGREGYGQLSSFEPDITATVLHRQVARHVLGSDPAQIDDLVDRVIDANMKFPWSYVCRALSGVDTAIWGEDGTGGRETHRTALIALGVDYAVFAAFHGRHRERRAGCGVQHRGGCQHRRELLQPGAESR